jgi:hypothetical protein
MHFNVFLQASAPNLYVVYLVVDGLNASASIANIPAFLRLRQFFATWWRMQILRRASQLIIAIALFALTIPSVTEVVSSWGSWLGFLQQAPFYVLAVLIVVGLLTETFTEFFVERRLAGAGGITGREFRANIERWRKVKQLTVGQVAWLWNELEPNAGSYDHTAANPTLHRLVQTLESGVLPDAKKNPDGWEATNLTRQELIDLAIVMGERPKFLFPKEFRRIERPAIPINEYRSITSEESRLAYAFTRQQGLPWDSEIDQAIKGEMTKWLRMGKWQAIGRETFDGLRSQFVRIPSASWHQLKRDRDAAEIGGRLYEDIRVRQARVE